MEKKDNNVLQCAICGTKNLYMHPTKNVMVILTVEKKNKCVDNTCQSVENVLCNVCREENHKSKNAKENFIEKTQREIEFYRPHFVFLSWEYLVKVVAKRNCDKQIPFDSNSPDFKQEFIAMSAIIYSEIAINPIYAKEVDDNNNVVMLLKERFNGENVCDMRFALSKKVIEKIDRDLNDLVNDAIKEYMCLEIERKVKQAPAVVTIEPPRKETRQKAKLAQTGTLFAP